MIKNIIFDIGNVLIRFDPKNYLKKFCDGEIFDNVYKTIFESEEWIMLDRGTITEEEAIEKFCKATPENENIIRMAMKNWHDILVPIDETVEILKILKGLGYRLYALSNYHKKAFEYTLNKNEFFDLFDGIVVSYTLNYIKPEREIYEYILEKYNLNQSETLFIDDIEKNIVAAKELGINAIKYENYTQLTTELKNMGIFKKRM